MNMDVPIVKDAVGETVQDAFETFLRTYVASSQLTRHLFIPCDMRCLDIPRKSTLRLHQPRMVESLLLRTAS